MKSAAKGVGKRSLDLPVAALAALSAGFVVYSLPADLLEQLVGAAGIANIIAAAQPPLGGTARLGLGIAAAVTAFALVYLLLRLIDRKPAVRDEDIIEEEPAPPRRRRIVEASAEEEQQPPSPRLRRWDAHPDAPARRPIFAASEFGEPDAPISPLAVKPDKSARAPSAPFWPPEDFPDSDSEEAEAWMGQQEQERPVEAAATEPEPAPVPAPAVEPEPLPEPAAEVVDEVETSAPDTAVPPPPAQAPEPEARQPVRGNESIAELMERLERGLSRRERDQAAPAAPSEQAPAPAPTAGEADSRLKNAIDSLQRIAARGL